MKIPSSPKEQGCPEFCSSGEVPKSQVESDEFSSWCPPPVPLLFGENFILWLFVNIAMEAMVHRNRWFTWVYLLKMGGSFHGKLLVYQRVIHKKWHCLPGLPVKMLDLTDSTKKFQIWPRNFVDFLPRNRMIPPTNIMVIWPTFNTLN